MRVSMWTSYFVEYEPREMVRVFAGRGWTSLELSDEHGHDLLKEGEPAAAGAALRAFAADRGVSFPQGHFLLATAGCRPDDLPGRTGADIAPEDDAAFRAVMDTMKRWVDLFAALGVEAGVLHAGGNRLAEAGWSKERVFARRVEAVRIVAEHAKGGPTAIALENMGGDRGLRTAGELVAIADAAGCSNVGLCLDTGHANIGGVDSAAFVREAGARLIALHVADNFGSKDDHLFPHGPGTTVVWPPIMAALRETGYRGLFNFEVPGESYSCPPPLRPARLDYARQLGEWMIAAEGAAG